MNVNKVFLGGKGVGGPEARMTASGIPVVNLRLATNRVFKDKSGQRQEQTEFHRVVVWGRQAEIAREYLRRGRMVFIEGRLQTRSWEDKSGQKRWQTEVVAERLQLGPRPGAAPPGESRPAQEGETGKAGKQKDADDTIPVIDEDAPISLHDDEPKEVNPEEIPF